MGWYSVGHRNPSELKVHMVYTGVGGPDSARALCRTGAVMLQVTSDWRKVTCLLCLRERPPTPWWQERMIGCCPVEESVRRGVAAYREGKVRPWAVIKRELGIGTGANRPYGLIDRAIFAACLIVSAALAVWIALKVASVLGGG